MSSTPTTPDPATQRAILIARTEQRRARMEQLAEVGMSLAKEIAVRFIDGPYHPEPRLDPGKSYAAVARSIRLTTTLEARADERILALCEGKAPISAWTPPASELAPTPWFAQSQRHRSRPADSSLNNEWDVERECLVDAERPDAPDIRAACRDVSCPTGRDAAGEPPLPPVEEETLTELCVEGGFDPPRSRPPPRSP